MAREHLCIQESVSLKPEPLHNACKSFPLAKLGPILYHHQSVGSDPEAECSQLLGTDVRRVYARKSPGAPLYVHMIGPIVDWDSRIVSNFELAKQSTDARTAVGLSLKDRAKLFPETCKKTAALMETLFQKTTTFVFANASMDLLYTALLGTHCCSAAPGPYNYELFNGGRKWTCAISTYASDQRSSN